MGGSRGFFGDKLTPEELAKRIRAAEEGAHDQEYDARVAELLGRLLASYNDRDTEAIRRHLETVKQALERDIAGSVELLFGGSVAKHTYVDGLSDIDMLVLLDRTELADRGPAYAKEYFARRLRERLSGTEIRMGDLAVTVRFDDVDVQLLPALRIGGAFRIPSARGDTWTSSDPKPFTSALTSLNEKLGLKLVPTIKLAKSILAGMPPDQQLTGYHVEALAVEVFRTYGERMTLRAMLRHFFTAGARRVVYPVADPSGQSPAVDEYLGEANSPQRQLIAHMLSRQAKHIRIADGSRRVELWQSILGVSG